MAGLARHLLAEYYGCIPSILDDQGALERILVGAADAARTTVVRVELHKFAPQGVSGVVILAESHIAIHTWPEHGFASVELYVCGLECEPEAGDAYLREHLEPTHVETRLLTRGCLEKARAYPPRVEPAAGVS